MSTTTSGRLVRVGDRLVRMHGSRPVPASCLRPLSVLARLGGSRLDRDLARGVEPWRSALHRTRSLQITAPRAREALADRLDHLVRRAQAPPRASAMGPAVPVDAAAVRAATAELAALAARLRGGQPVATGAVAALRELLCDGAGPVYLRGSGHLGHALAAILDYIDVP